MNINITIPTAAVKAAMVFKKRGDKKPSRRSRLRSHLPKRASSYVKVELLDMQVILNIADTYRSEVDSKMERKYGKEVK